MSAKFMLFGGFCAAALVLGTSCASNPPVVDVARPAPPAADVPRRAPLDVKVSVVALKRGLPLPKDEDYWPRAGSTLKNLAKSRLGCLVRPPGIGGWEPGDLGGWTAASQLLVDELRATGRFREVALVVDPSHAEPGDVVIEGNIRYFWQFNREIVRLDASWKITRPGAEEPIYDAELHQKTPTGGYSNKNVRIACQKAIRTIASKLADSVTQRLAPKKGAGGSGRPEKAPSSSDMSVEEILKSVNSSD